MAGTSVGLARCWASRPNLRASAAGALRPDNFVRYATAHEVDRTAQGRVCFVDSWPSSWLSAERADGQIRTDGQPFSKPTQVRSADRQEEAS
jgi:hypothetical protein